MTFSTIPEMFLNTTNNFADKYLYYYKKADQWIGLKGKDIKNVVHEISAALKSLKIENQDKVAIMSNNSPRWAMSDYGILCSGNVTVTIYPTLVQSQVDYIINDSGSKLIFVENKIQMDKAIKSQENCHDLAYIIVMNDTYEGDNDRVLNFLDFLELGNKYINDNEYNLENITTAIKPNDLLTLIYTSGTTGTPKGVMLSHENLCSNIIATTTLVEFTDNDILLSFLPLSHVFERMGGHFSSFSRGCSTYYAEGIDKVADNMGEVKPTLMLSVPRLYEKMHTGVIDKVKAGSSLKQKIFYWSLDIGRKVSEHNLSNKEIPGLLKFQHKIASKLAFSKIHERVGGRLRFFISGGAPLAQEIGEFFSSAGIQIMEGYGLTETSPVLTTNLPDQFRFGTVGKPITGVEIKIADDGEILAKGPNIMQGYYNDPESTDKVLSKDGWFSTGDIGEFEDGFLKITDRKKNILVTSGGKNVAPAPLENSLATSPYIDQVLVLGHSKNFISALIVPNFEIVTKYLSSINKSVSGNEAIIEHNDVIELISNEVENAMVDFSNYEKVKVFKLLSEPFSIDKGEMTPKMSIVRKVVMRNHHDLIESIYN
ncbi:MAG: long-chain acyl-CoA synthetase [Candidatus Marinimicrobia bacterium]|nr:long-chain acyl-CoA synthetase [Candidatus Neomarinimicrobiota bacterium]